MLNCPIIVNYKSNMLFQVLVFALVDFSSSYTEPQECYGGSYRFTAPLPTTNIYYMSRTSNEKILVVNKGKSVHERFEASVWAIKMKYLTEEDDGAKLFFDNRKAVQLTITDCRTPDTRDYGSSFSWSIPSSAEYMEFTRVLSSDSPEKPVVIWNRTNPTLSRAKINDNTFELNDLKQPDSGYYKFRGAYNQLLKWKRLIVEAHYKYFDHTEGELLVMDFPYEFQLSHIDYVPEGSNTPIEKFYRRGKMEVYKSYFALRDLKYEDRGTYRFIDDNGNMAAHLQLNVIKNQIPTWGYVAIVAVIVFGLLICCCCMKKCCCKKSSSKRNSPGSNELAAPVYYHDSNQPTPSTVILLSNEPRRFHADATIHDAAASGIGPPTNNQATVTRDMGPTSLIATSTDIEPQFEMKGSLFPSAPPLSSDTSIQHVYTSDKLNFL